MSDLQFKLILRTVDRATAPIKALVGVATAGNAKVIASTTKATAAVQKFKVAQSAATVSAKQLGDAAEGIKRGVEPARGLARTLEAVRGISGGVSSVLDRIGSNGAFRRQSHDADHLASHADHANHRLHAVLRTVTEMAELGPLGHLLAHATPWIGAAALGFGAVAAARGVWELGAGSAEYVADSANRAKKVGIPDVGAYQRLAYAGNYFEVDQQQLDTGLKRLSSFVYSMKFQKNGGVGAKILRSIGVSSTDARGALRPITDLFADIADRMKVLPAGMARTGAAMKLFGRSGSDLVPLLSQGGAAIRSAMKDAEDFGLVVGGKSVEQSEEFVQSQRRMAGAVKGLKVQLGLTLVEPLTRATKGIVDFIKAHRPEVIKTMTSAVNGVVKALPTLLAAVGKIDWGAFAVGVVSLAGSLATVVGWCQKLGSALKSGLGGTLAGVAAAAAVIGGALLALPIEVTVAAVVAAIAAVGAAFYFLPRAWTAVGNWFKAHTYLPEIFASIVKVWSGLPSFFSGLWQRTKASFLGGVTSLWNSLPGWLQVILKGAAIVAQIQLGIPVLPSVLKPPQAVKPRPAIPSSLHRAVGSARRIALASGASNDDLGQVGGRALASIHPYGLAASIRPTAPAASIARTGGERSLPEGTLRVEVKVHQDGRPPEVVSVRADTSPGWHIDVKRGAAA